MRSRIARGVSGRWFRPGRSPRSGDSEHTDRGRRDPELRRRRDRRRARFAGRGPDVSGPYDARCDQMPPKERQLPFAQRWSNICSSGKWSPGPVLIAIPGSRNGFFDRFMFEAALTSAGAGQVLAEFLEQLDRRPGDGHPVHVVDVVRVRARRVPLHDRPVQLHGRVRLPLRVGRILEEDDRDRPGHDLVLPALGGEEHDVRGRGDGVVDTSASASSRACWRRRSPGWRTSASRRSRACPRPRP